MAFRGTLLLVVCFCVLAYVHSFVNLVCGGQTVGEIGQQSMLNCIIKPSMMLEDVNIVTVIWKKMTSRKPVLFFKENMPIDLDSSYIFAEPSWNKKNMNVSLLIKSTKLEDEGVYVCDVSTDSGIARAKTSLIVTAKYNEPMVNLTEEKDIPHADKALVCRAQGGYPEGTLRWFDGNRIEWTKSAELEVKKMDNGLFELSSKLPLLPGSTFSEYICVVYNSSGGKEHEIVFHPNTVAETSQDDQGISTSKIVAPVVVIGSLIVGLLLVLLNYRRRLIEIRRPSSTPFLAQRQQCPTEDLENGAP